MAEKTRYSDAELEEFRAIILEKLQRGKDADIVLLDRDLNVRAVWAMGKLVEGTNKLF